MRGLPVDVNIQGQMENVRRIYQAFADQHLTQSRLPFELIGDRGRQRAGAKQAALDEQFGRLQMPKRARSDLAIGQGAIAPGAVAPGAVAPKQRGRRPVSHLNSRLGP